MMDRKFLLCVLIGDHRVAVHLRTGSRNRENRPKRQCSFYRRIPYEKHIPGVTIMIDPGRYRLGTINGASTTDSHKTFNVMFSAEFHTLLYMRNPWVRLHSR